MILGFRLGPDFLHRLDEFTYPLEAGGVDRPVVFHFILVPTATDAEQKATLADLVERCDQLGGLDRIALLHQQDPGAQFDGAGHLAGGCQHHEGIHRVVIRFRQVAAARIGRFARERDMRVFRRPDQFKAAVLQRASKLHGRHRVVGEEHHATEFHVQFPSGYLPRCQSLVDGCRGRHRGCREDTVAPSDKSISVNLTELHDALEFVSAGALSEHIEQLDRYIAVPDQNELGLARIWHCRSSVGNCPAPTTSPAAYNFVCTIGASPRQSHGLRIRTSFVAYNGLTHRRADESHRSAWVPTRSIIPGSLGCHHCLSPVSFGVIQCLLCHPSPVSPVSSGVIQCHPVSSPCLAR